MPPHTKTGHGGTVGELRTKLRSRTSGGACVRGHTGARVFMRACITSMLGGGGHPAHCALSHPASLLRASRSSRISRARTRCCTRTGRSFSRSTTTVRGCMRLSVSFCVSLPCRRSPPGRQLAKSALRIRLCSAPRAADPPGHCPPGGWGRNRQTQNEGYINYTRVMWSDHSYSYDNSAYQVRACWP